jgi:hypothetical protein
LVLPSIWNGKNCLPCFFSHLELVFLVFLLLVFCYQRCTCFWCPNYSHPPFTM